MRYAILALALLACGDIDDTPAAPAEPTVDYCGPLAEYEWGCCRLCGGDADWCQSRRDVTLTRSQFWCEREDVDRNWCDCGRY